jgi:hypothetical protein
LRVSIWNIYGLPSKIFRNCDESHQFASFTVEPHRFTVKYGHLGDKRANRTSLTISALALVPALIKNKWLLAVWRGIISSVKVFVSVGLG